MPTLWDDFRWDQGIWDDDSAPGTPTLDPSSLITARARAYRPRWQLFVRDGDTLNRVAEIDEWTDAQLVVRHNGIGTWQLTLPADHPAARLLLRPRAGLIAERDGQVVLAGPRGARSRARAADQHAATVTCSGWSDEVWLGRRIALDPADGDADPRTGVASTLILAYVDAHAGPAARADRRVPGLTIGTDPAIGATQDRAGRRRLLIDLVTEIARAADTPIGFRIRQATGSLVAEVFAPTDRTAQVVFSLDAGTLAGYEFGDEAAEANWLWLGGEATGASRVFATVSDSASIVEVGRIEQWADHTDIDTAAALRVAGRADLAERAGSRRIEATPLAGDSLRWQRDWNLGDRVTCLIEGERITEQIRELDATIGPDGSEQLTVRVGADGARLARKELLLMRRAAQIDRRVRTLETA